MSHITLETAAELLATKGRVLILTHARPDGDTLGSAFGLRYALEAAGREARVCCADEVPPRLRFLTEGQADLRAETVEDFSPDAVVALDTAELSLMGENAALYGERIDLKIDHHPKGAAYAAHNHIDGESAATGELIYTLVRELERLGAGKMTAQAAGALYAAIASDTGCFRYSNVTPHTLRTAAALMEAGADFVDCNRRLFESCTREEMQAERLALNGMHWHRNESVVSFCVSNEMKQENGLSDDSFSGIVSMLREMEGVELAIVLRELNAKPMHYKVSMRSGERIFADKLCARFGGGGHARAAGAEIVAETAEQAEDAVIRGVLEELEHA